MCKPKRQEGGSASASTTSKTKFGKKKTGKSKKIGDGSRNPSQTNIGTRTILGGNKQKIRNPRLYVAPTQQDVPEDQVNIYRVSLIQSPFQIKHAMTSKDEGSIELPGGVKPATSVCAVKTALLREFFLFINVAMLFQLPIFHCLQRLLRSPDQNVMNRVNK